MNGCRPETTALDQQSRYARYAVGHQWRNRAKSPGEWRSAFRDTRSVARVGIFSAEKRAALSTIAEEIQRAPELARKIAPQTKRGQDARGR